MDSKTPKNQKRAKNGLKKRNSSLKETSGHIIIDSNMM